MEISNNSHFSTDAYLLSQQRNKADQDNVSPLGKIQDEKKSDRAQATETEAVDNEETKRLKHDTESNEVNTFQANNLRRAHHLSQQNAQRPENDYTVTAHDSVIARQTEKALASYNSVENSQYGQELVNRIELMV